MTTTRFSDLSVDQAREFFMGIVKEVVTPLIPTDEKPISRKKIMEELNISGTTWWRMKKEHNIKKHGAKSKTS